MDGGQPDLRRGGAGVEEEEGSRRKEKKGEEEREEGGDADKVGCAAPLLAAVVIHQCAEAAAVDVPRPVAARARRRRSPLSRLRRDDVRALTSLLFRELILGHLLVYMRS
jgi:hypothetical protein